MTEIKKEKVVKDIVEDIQEEIDIEREERVTEYIKIKIKGIDKNIREAKVSLKKAEGRKKEFLEKSIEDVEEEMEAVQCGSKLIGWNFNGTPMTK